MTRKRFQKLNRALLAVSGKDTKDTGLMRMLYADKYMPKEGLSYETDWYLLNLFGKNPYGVGVKAEMKRCTGRSTMWPTGARAEKVCRHSSNVRRRAQELLEKKIDAAIRLMEGSK